MDMQKYMIAASANKKNHIVLGKYQWAWTWTVWMLFFSLNGMQKADVLYMQFIEKKSHQSHYYCVSSTMEPNRKQNTADSLELFVVVISFYSSTITQFLHHYCKICATIRSHFNGTVHFHSLNIVRAIYNLQHFYNYIFTIA